jgi:hypothetical protein
MNSSAYYPKPDFSGPTPPFPTRRLCRVGISLLSTGTMKELRLLGVCLVHSLFTCGAIPPLTLCIRSHPRQDRRVCAGTLVSRCRPYPACVGGEAKLSHVCREPSVASALLFPIPVGSQCQVNCGTSMLSPLLRSRGPRHAAIYRDSITQLQRSLSTLRAALTNDDARLASVRRPPFHRRELHPQGSDRTFQL